MSASGSSARYRWAAAIVCAALVSTLAALWFAAFNPIVGLAPDRDSGIFLYIGQQVLRGQALYRDLFDGKGPIVYLFNALGLSIGGGSMWGVYVLYLALLCLAFVLVFLGFRRRFGLVIGAAATFYGVLLLSLTAVSVMGNNADGFVWLTQLAALFLLTRWQSDDPRVFPYVLLGLVGASAFFVKWTAVGLWVALLVAEVLVAAKSSEWRRLLRHVVSLAAGAGGMAVVMLVYLGATGSLGSFFRVYFAFNSVYGRAGSDRWRSLVEGIQLVGYVNMACFAAIWIVLLLRASGIWRSHRTPDLLVLLALIWWPIDFVVACYAGHGSRYFYPTLPALILLFALASSEVARARQSVHPSGIPPGERPRIWFLTALLLVAVFALAPALLQSARSLGGILVHRSSYAHDATRGTYPGSCYPRVADYVRQHAATDDHVLVWGDYSQATNFLADRRSPTRFVYQPYLYDATTGQDLVPEFLNDLKAHPPTMIIDTSPSSERYLERPSMESVVDGRWPDGEDADFQAAWRQVGDFLRDNYTLVEDLPFAPGWKVYALRRA